MENNIYNLIAKHLAKETSETEEKQLQNLIDNDEEIKVEYDEAKIVWQKSAINPQSYDIERGKQLLHRKIERAEKSWTIHLQRVMKYAAVFIGISLMAFLVWQDLNRTETILASANEILKMRLPDNSIVFLNKNAQITYNVSRIKTFDRKVELKGEAFFEIAKQDGKKFIVDAKNLSIQVLGTKFNVKQNSGQTTVTLNEGKVKLTNFVNNEQKQLMMKPGDVVNFDSRSGKIQQKQANPDIYNLWLKKRLSFDNFSISDLSEIFRIHYQKTLIIKNKDFGSKIKGSAPTDDLDLLLKALAIVLGKEIYLQNDSIIIE